MKVKLVFYDWRDKGIVSIYNTEMGLSLSMGQFHSGTTFDADIHLDPSNESELAGALDAGFVPVFYLCKK